MHCIDVSIWVLSFYNHHRFLLFGYHRFNVGGCPACALMIMLLELLASVHVCHDRKATVTKDR